MRLALAIGVAASLTMMFATGCASQTAARQQTETTTSQAAPQGSDTKGSSTRNDSHPGLMDPNRATEQAPEKYQVKVSTTKGDFVIDVTRKWSPNGADRFFNLVKVGYFKDIVIFRAINGFMFQFGIHGDPAISQKWSGEISRMTRMPVSPTKKAMLHSQKQVRRIVDPHRCS